MFPKAGQKWKYKTPYLESHLSHAARRDSTSQDAVCVCLSVCGNFFKDVTTVTMPIQGTVCNPNDKLSPGEPVYKIWSLYL